MPILQQFKKKVGNRIITDVFQYLCFKHSMAGFFLLRAVYGTLVTPSLAFRQDEAKDGMCRLCATEVVPVQHILSGCKVALEQGRYTWRHGKVLIQIQSHVAYHLGSRVNNPKKPVSTQKRDIPFVRAGAKGKEMPNRQY